MPFVSGTAPGFDSFESGHRRLFRIFRRFVTGAPEIDDVQFSGAGDGEIGLIDTGVGCPTETWTIKFTTATDFTVTGSDSGAMTGGTIGTNYASDNDEISFRIEAGTTPFEADDEFTISVVENTDVTGNDRWEIDRWDPFAADLELIMHGVGLAGADAIYVGLRVTDDATNQRWYYEMRGYTGYSPSDPWDTQPGASPHFYTPVWNQSMPFWIAVNGRRIILVAKAGTTYHAFYLGFMLPYATPLEHPYPLVICGEHPITTLVPYTSTALNTFNDPGQGTGSQPVSGALRKIGGTWVPLQQGNGSAVAVWPYDATTEGRAYLLNQEPIGSDYVLFPMNLIDRSPGSSVSDMDVLGYYDGVYAVCGFGQTAENTITINTDTYHVFPNVYRSGRADFWCLKEE